MVGTIMVHGSDGKVMAPFGQPGTFIEGRRRKIQVIGVSKDEDTPLLVREALVGMTVPIIFTGEEVNKHFRKASQIDPKMMLAYVSEVIEVLQSAGKKTAARALKQAYSEEFDMYCFESETFEILST